jgi:hypothetical protein
MNNEYYTYAYLREDGTPYYIGKGTNRRAYLQLNHNVKVPTKERILILKNRMTNDEANRHERYMIFVLGRKNIGTGILRNLTEGGEGVLGLKQSEESKKKMRKPKSEEHKKKVRDSIKAKWDNGEYDKQEWRNRELGKKQSGETIKKKSESLKKYYEKNKKIVTEEQKKQISETLKKKYKNGEIKIIPPSPNLSAKWWNNGEINTRSVECPGLTWKRGRIKSK